MSSSQVVHAPTED